MNKYYLEPTQEAGAKLFSKQLEGEIYMLNLLRFKDTADYTEFPDLAPIEPISGNKAFDFYIKCTTPFLKDSGGDIVFMGKCSDFFIGPSDETWDFVMLIKQKSLQSFLAFASNPAYMKILGHREAAIIDSRLLPVENYNI
tara:strand:- start:51 stop:473 length:423 start_codon:yes stop_codon:yes gene_type:complete